MEPSLCTSELYNTLHLSNIDRSMEVLINRITKQLNRDIVHIGKAMRIGLIKGRVRRDSNKYYNWYNEQIIVGSQIYNVYHVPKLLKECIFEKNYIRLNKEREI